jgi:hypothetical protein
MRYPRGLPAGGYDYAALVRQFADSYEPLEAPSEDDPAYESASEAFTQRTLLSEFATPTAEGARVLVSAGAGPRAALSRLLGAWAAGGSAVLLHPSATSMVERIRTAEKITSE